MDKTEQIKSIILKKYPSIRAFATESGIPHGTIVSALNNGIESMSYGKVLKICEILQIDCGTFEPLNVEVSSMNSDEKRLLVYYKLLDDKKRNKVLEYIDDISGESGKCTGNMKEYENKFQIGRNMNKISNMPHDRSIKIAKATQE